MATDTLSEHRDLSGRTAVVTGAGGAVGRAIAQALLAHGARVALVARRAAAMDELAGRLGENARAFTADVSQQDDVERLATETAAWGGACTIVVNSAGTFGPIAHVAQDDAGEWVKTIHTNVVGTYLVCRAYIPEMIEARWGRILNVSSAASLHPPGEFNSAYATSKVAVNQLTRQLAVELAGTGVTANVLHPGEIKSDMWQDITDRATAGRIPALIEWSEWVAATGGDPPEKAGELVLENVLGDGSVNGQFLWIRNPLQAPVRSWPAASETG